jgi:hypothetical protein
LQELDIYQVLIRAWSGIAPLPFSIGYFSAIFKQELSLLDRF